MPARLTQEEYLSRVRKTHGERYNYSKVHYVNSSSCVTIGCKIHGEFSIIAGNFALGQGCPKCGRIRATRKNTNDVKCFLDNARKVHGDRYDYSLVNYKNSKEKVKIICPEHGVFEQTPNNHLHGYGCPDCGRIKCACSRSLNNEDFIRKANEKHNYKYDYSKANYVTGKSKVSIICPHHGEFIQLAEAHLLGHGCPRCSAEAASQNMRSNTDDFIKKAIVIWGNEYDYSKVNYISATDKVCVNCRRHGDFYVKATAHLLGTGCPDCSHSAGERTIRVLLDNHNIPYEREKSFPGCVDKNKLRFDFYLPELNTCIEFQGKQHYENTGWVFTDDNVADIQRRDKIKRDYCAANNINLIEIKYNESINKKLSFLW